MDLGKKLREVRKRKGLTLQQVASGAGVSKSFISQIESGATKPSIASLKKVGDVLGIPIAALFEEEAANGGPGGDAVAEGEAGVRADVRVVRRNRRKMLVWPDSEGETYLLTPDLQRKLEVTLSTYLPGYETGLEAYTHVGEEFGFVLEGRCEITVGDQVYELEEGDSIYYQSHIPHKMRVLGDRPVKTIWVITPPSF